MRKQISSIFWHLLNFFYLDLLLSGLGILSSLTDQKTHTTPPDFPVYILGTTYLLPHMLTLPWNKLQVTLAFHSLPLDQRVGVSCSLKDWLAKSTAPLATGFEYPAGVASVSHDRWNHKAPHLLYFSWNRVCGCERPLTKASEVLHPERSLTADLYREL